MTARAPRPRVTLASPAGRRPVDGERTGIAAILPHRLHPPRSLVEPIERRVLLGRIEEGLAGQVVAIHGPAGFGKTELLTAAFHRLRRPGDRFGWMTLDEADADPAVFLHDLGAAIALAQGPATARPEVSGQDVGGQGVSGQATDDAIARLRAMLLADPGPLVVFLDAFHTPNSPTFRHCVEQLLRRLPDSVRFVLASRGRPDIPLSRLRTRNMLTEIRAADLAFTRGEVQRLLGNTLSPQDTSRALEVTAGWPALVHLSRPILLDIGDLKGRADLLAGTHPLIRAFLDEEFLADLPADLRRALDVCAILDDFPLDLVSDLAGIEAGAVTLTTIDRFAPLIQPLPQRPTWLVLHPVVRAAMREQADRQPASRSAALHIRAASWFAERGILDKAVRHAAHGGDFTLAIEAIRRAGGVNIFLRAGYTVLIRLLSDLPSAVIHHSPTLRLCHALVLSKEGQVQAAREIIDELKRAGAPAGPPLDAAPIPAADLEHIDGMIDIYEDKRLDDEQIARLERAAHDFGAYDNWERGWIYNHLCIAFQRKGALRAARLAGLRALSCYREAKTPYAQIFMLAHVGAVLMATGRLSAALATLRDADRLVQETQWSDGNIAALVHIPLATTLYHRGEVAEAARLLGAAMPVVARGEGWVDMFARGFATLARAKFLSEGVEAGLAVLDQAEVLALERDLPRLEVSILTLRIDLLTRGGLLESAAHLAERRGPLPEPQADADLNWPTNRERFEAVAAQARLLTRLGRPRDGLELATGLAAAAGDADAGLDVLAAEVIAVEALWVLDEPDQALRTLQKAIAVAIPQHAVQILRDGDAVFATVLRAIVRRFGLTTFRSDGAAFLGAILGPVQPQRFGDLSTSAAAILTTREAEVLAGLERGLSNKLIARDLGLTEAAVKFHLKNLFRKLGVGRRTLAISVARDVGLL